MAVDSTAKAKNIKDSVKKYLIDDLVTSGGLELTFDKSFIQPDLQDEKVDQWLVCAFGNMKRGGLSNHSVQIFCMTRKDDEGDKLVQLADLVFDSLTDATKPDGKRRIPLYESSTWTQVGAIVVQEIIDSDEMNGPDNTNIRILTCLLQWVAKA